MEAIIRKLPPKLFSIIVVSLLIYLVVIITVAVFRGQTIDIWGLKISEIRAKVQAERDKTDKPNILEHKQNNILLKERINKYQQEIQKLTENLSKEQNLRLSKDNRIDELESELKRIRGSNYKQLMRKLSNIEIKVENDEIKLLEVHKQYEALSIQYYPKQSRCNNGESSFYYQECKEAGELQGSIDGIKLRIESLKKTIENNNQKYKLLIEMTEKT